MCENTTERDSELSLYFYQPVDSELSLYWNLFSIFLISSKHPASVLQKFARKLDTVGINFLIVHGPDKVD